MQELSKGDLNFVLSRCPKDIVKLLKVNAGKLFLAGGFIRSTIAGDKVADIDLFGDTQENLLRIAKDLTLDRKGRYFTTANAITVLSPPRFAVQFITRWLFDKPEKLIESFDFTVCQAVIYAEEIQVESPDENKEKSYKFHSLISDAFYPDLAARRLVYTFPHWDEDVGGSLVRAVKFIKKGYNIQAPSLAGVVSRIASKVDSDLFVKGDEKWIAFVLTGLLREVDPLLVIDGVDFVNEHEVIQP